MERINNRINMKGFLQTKIHKKWKIQSITLVIIIMEQENHQKEEIASMHSLKLKELFSLNKHD